MRAILSKSVLKRSIQFLIFAIIITAIAMAITYIIDPNLEEVNAGLNSNLPEQTKEAEGLEKVWSFIVNNGFMVPLQMLILAFIPIQFLYLLNIISTAAIPGVLFGIVLQADFTKGLGIIISAAPHYIFEIFAYCLFAAVLFKLNQAIRGKISNLFRKDKTESTLIKNILQTGKMYVAFTLPIIVIAAFLETYIADIIFNLFE